MADSNGTIDALVYVDDMVTDEKGEMRHAIVEVNNERANLNDPTSLAKF